MLRKLDRHVVAELIVAAIAVFAHMYALASLPRGFHIDESSIGYNAMLIASTGRDEHGVSWPLFFKAFGEYKNPLYVYLAALLIKVFGYSSYTVRFTSCVCWMIGAGFTYALGRRLFSEPALRLYLLIALAFTPSLFCLSRVAFEVVSLFSVLGAFLWWVHRAFEEQPARPLASAFAAGIAIGLTTYAYTTFRLLAPLHCVWLVLCYGQRVYWRRLTAVALGAVVSVIPFACYLVWHRDALTNRFNAITYVARDIPLSSKLVMFGQRYISYFDPVYLVASGDGNLRHHTGYGGQLLLPTALGLALALLGWLTHPQVRAARFQRLVWGGLLLSPLAAALTDDLHHSLRAFSQPLFAVLLSVYGFQLISAAFPRSLLPIVTSCLALNAGLFGRNYFGSYAGKTIEAFDNYGLQEAARKAVAEAHGRVVVDDESSAYAAINRDYVSSLLRSSLQREIPPFELGRRADLRPGDVFIFRDPERHYPALHAGLPKHTLYVAQRYDQLGAKRKGRK